MIAAWAILSLFTGMVLGGAFAACLGGAGGGRDEVVSGGRDRVGVIELAGPILDATSTVRDIRAFAKRDDLRALVVRIDSPGGAVAPSQELYDALRAASKEKPVVASMGTVAASGGFWSAMGADWVFANPGTLTGSIGVITQLPDLRGIAEALRFRMVVFKSGPLKDAGNAFREMTEEDRALFQSLIDDIYEQFVAVVAERRKLEADAVKKVADGRVMTGRAALEAGLVDQLGGLHDAARKAVELADLRASERGEGTAATATAAKDEEREDPTLVYPKKPMPGLLDLVTQGARAAIAEGLASGVERASRNLSESPGVELR